jgi:plastocyanin
MGSRERTIVLVVAGVLSLAVAVFAVGRAIATEGNSGTASTQTTTAGGAQGGAATEVKVSGFQFLPPSVTVKAGQAVKWTNEDPFSHSVLFSADVSPEQPLGASGGTASITFPNAGSFPYICGIHNNMTGTVVVEA